MILEWFFICLYILNKRLNQNSSLGGPTPGILVPAFADLLFCLAFDGIRPNRRHLPSNSVLLWRKHAIYPHRP